MRIAIIAIALGAAVVAGPQLATARDVNVGVGPGGVYVGVGNGYRRGHWRSHYARECRVIVRHRINRYGERVTIRKRVCD